ncbi:hypothetical protein IFT41_23995 [Pantoea agglomerans]|uniref:Uncharacterized protein n=1 Tax=Enterobacter agglomerans TaxID=549 RepID=A0ACC5PVE2_ENTAG|nr:hypothetical protein [Pantoea agglomerans]
MANSDLFNKAKFTKNDLLTPDLNRTHRVSAAAPLTVINKRISYMLATFFKRGAIICHI